MRDWVKWDSGASVAAYAARMAVRKPPCAAHLAACAARMAARKARWSIAMHSQEQRACRMSRKRAVPCLSRPFGAFVFPPLLSPSRSAAWRLAARA